jgi:hypothetical protein
MIHVITIVGLLGVIAILLRTGSDPAGIYRQNPWGLPQLGYDDDPSPAQRPVAKERE